MKIALRDDDTCYFTSPDELERVYGDVWHRVPVCLATVPFAVGYPRVGIPESEWHSGRRYPLEENQELVEWLRRRIAERRITIALHGYTHEDYPDGFEFQAAPDLDRRVLSEGAAILSHAGAWARVEDVGRLLLHRLGFGYVAWLVDLVTATDAEYRVEFI